jgi:hypothetical protein
MSSAEPLKTTDRLFQLQLKNLREGRATFPRDLDSPALQSPDEAAVELVRMIALQLRHGSLPPIMAKVLADYLETLDSPQRWALLGLSVTNRRRSVAGQEESAVLAYAEASKLGCNEQDALITMPILPRHLTCAANAAPPTRPISKCQASRTEQSSA